MRAPSLPAVLGAEFAEGKKAGPATSLQPGCGWGVERSHLVERGTCSHGGDQQSLGQTDPPQRGRGCPEPLSLRPGTAAQADQAHHLERGSTAVSCPVENGTSQQ